MKTASLVVAAGLVVQSFGFAAASPSQEQPRNGVTMPRVVREVKPNYSDSAKKEGIQGIVTLNAVVKKDGTVGEVTVKKSLHPDLDEEAVKAMKQWEFKPGTKEGKPADVAVDVEMSFKLK
jgi:protein TonB